MKKLFLDTETTGNQEDDVLCQVAYKLDDQEVSENFKPEKPISIESMAVHHITNEMVNDAPIFKESDLYKDLEEKLNDEEMILIAHNANFDLEMLKKEGLEPKKHICTMKLTRFLDSEGKIPRHNLQYLRYYLDLKTREVQAHDALGDVVVLEKLFERILEKFKKLKTDKSEEEILEEMMDISSRPSLLVNFTFGKHSGKRIKDIAEEEPGYLQWLLKEKEKQGEKNEEDWIYTLKYYLNKE